MKPAWQQYSSFLVQNNKKTVGKHDFFFFPLYLPAILVKAWTELFPWQPDRLEACRWKLRSKFSRYPSPQSFSLLKNCKCLPHVGRWYLWKLLCLVEIKKQIIRLTQSRQCQNYQQIPEYIWPQQIKAQPELRLKLLMHIAADSIGCRHTCWGKHYPIFGLSEP